MAKLKLFVVGLICMLILDGIWLGFVGINYYKQYLGGLILTNDQGGISPRVIPAILVYCFLLIGQIYLVINKSKNPLSAFGRGMLFGLVVYGTYDFTNLAVLSLWQWQISVIDVLWGTVLCGITGWVMKFFAHNYLPREEHSHP